jgi:hypothetical protein
VKLDANPLLTVGGAALAPGIGVINGGLVVAPAGGAA